MLRTGAGLTSGEAARLVGWHQAGGEVLDRDRCQRRETGRSAVTAGRLPGAGRHLREVLLMLAAEEDAGGRHRWWHACTRVLPPTCYRDFISLESQASAMRTLETTRSSPGLLRRRAEYARAGDPGGREGPGRGAPGQAGRGPGCAAGRMTLRSDPPLVLSAVLDEAVLRREVGRPRGDGPAAGTADGGRAPAPGTAQVLPFGAGAHVGLTGPSLSSPFPSTSDLDVACSDQLTSSLYLERKEDLMAYATEAFNTPSVPTPFPLRIR